MIPQEDGTPVIAWPEVHAVQITTTDAEHFMQPCRKHDISLEENREQSATLAAIVAACGVYPEFAQVDWKFDHPVITKVTLSWEQFVTLARIKVEDLYDEEEKDV